MQITLPCSCRLARVNSDPTSAIVTLLPEKFVQYGKRFGAIRSGNQENLREMNVIPRIGCAIDAERLVVSRRSRDHLILAIGLTLRSTLFPYTTLFRSNFPLSIEVVQVGLYCDLPSFSHQCSTAKL